MPTDLMPVSKLEAQHEAESDMNKLHTIAVLQRPREKCSAQCRAWNSLTGSNAKIFCAGGPVMGRAAKAKKKDLGRSWEGSVGPDHKGGEKGAVWRVQ